MEGLAKIEPLQTLKLDPAMFKDEQYTDYF